MDELIGNDLQIAPVVGDAALYVKKDILRETIAISGTYFDDFFNSKTPDFEKILEKTLKHFEPKTRVYDKFDYLGS